MTDANQQLQSQIQQELNDITLSVMAYRAEQIVSAISIANQRTNDTIQAKENYIREKFGDAIITMRDGKAFYPERTQEIINRYTPLSALNKDGAGHILFSDQQNPNTIHVAMRGSEEFLTDWLRSDTGNIAIGDGPMHQTSLIVNFIASETAPAATSVPKVKFDNQLRD